MVAAIIVLYNPDALLLDRLLESVAGQVQRIFVVDNTPGSSAELSPIKNEYGGITTYIPLVANLGIATAQNTGIRQAIEGGYSHMLLLDQDSALPAGMISALLDAEQALLSTGHKVAAVGPVFVDEKTGQASTAIRHRYLRVHKLPIDQSSPMPIEADYLISSGSLIRTTVLNDVGMMRDELFIDWVDIEWGLRARDKGYRTYIVPGAAMSHSIGDSTVRAISRDINLHNSTRNYYIVRNATYLLRVGTMGWSWRLISAIKIPQYIIFYSWHSPDRVKSVLLLLRGFADGLRGKLGRLS